MLKKTKFAKKLLVAVVLILFILMVPAYYFYGKIYNNNVNEGLHEGFLLYIPTGADFNTVVDSLKANNIVIDLQSFIWVAEKKNYVGKVKSGRYEILPGQNNNTMVNMLRAGNQKPVKLTFNSIRTKYELSGKIAHQLEFDSVAFIDLLNDKEYLKTFGLNPESVISMFIPNTYQVYWNVKPKDLFVRMNKEYKKFWNENRTAKLNKLNMSKLQASTLASIVQAEQSVRRDEQAKIAGVYINRMKIGMHLESCPTLIFAIGDFTRQRVLNKDKEIVSPFNTYMNPGLPPSPINLPEISAIDAVLNYEEHNYIFFCAREDFSGYHYFSTNYTDHNRYAQRYQLALNKKGIKK
jgi:UPF0755 protein